MQLVCKWHLVQNSPFHVKVFRLKKSRVENHKRTTLTTITEGTAALKLTH